MQRKEHTSSILDIKFDDLQMVSSSVDDSILIWDFSGTTPAPSSQKPQTSVSLSSDKGSTKVKGSPAHYYQVADERRGNDQIMKSMVVEGKEEVGKGRRRRRRRGGEGEEKGGGGEGEGRGAKEGEREGKARGDGRFGGTEEAINVDTPKSGVSGGAQGTAAADGAGSSKLWTAVAANMDRRVTNKPLPTNSSVAWTIPAPVQQPRPKPAIPLPPPPAAQEATDEHQTEEPGLIAKILKWGDEQSSKGVVGKIRQLWGQEASSAGTQQPKKKFDVYGIKEGGSEMTLQDFLDHVLNEHKLKVNSLALCNGSIVLLYSIFMSRDNIRRRMQMP